MPSFDFPSSWVRNTIMTAEGKQPTADRIKVEDGSTALSQNQAFRISEPLELDTALEPTLMIELNAPVNFNLVQQSLFCDLGGFLYQVYRSEQVENVSGFTEPVAVIRRNNRTDAPDYTPQISVNKGGTFTPKVGKTPVDTIRLRAGNNTNKATNVGGSENSARGLPPDKYYILITGITGITGLLTGVLELLFDEV